MEWCCPGWRRGSRCSWRPLDDHAKAASLSACRKVEPLPGRLDRWECVRFTRFQFKSGPVAKIDQCVGPIHGATLRTNEKADEVTGNRSDGCAFVVRVAPAFSLSRR